MDKRRFIVYVLEKSDDIEAGHLFKFPKGVDAHTKQEAVDLVRKECDGQIRCELARYGIQYADIRWDAEDIREAEARKRLREAG